MWCLVLLFSVPLCNASGLFSALLEEVERRRGQGGKLDIRSGESIVPNKASLFEKRGD